MSDGAAPTLVELKDTVFSWRRGRPVVHVPHFEIGRGEKVFLRGPSGSGKSTLLGLVAGVLTAQKGSVTVLGHNLSAIGGARRDALRAAHMGVIFQMLNLIPFLSVIGNVALPCRFSAVRRQRVETAGGSVEAEARALLEALGLEREQWSKPVRELSVGQQQRVAAARAIIGGPDLVIADEPTSALDADTRDRFIDLLIGETARRKAALLFVSHDAALAPHFDRAVDLASINLAGQDAGAQA